MIEYRQEKKYIVSRKQISIIIGRMKSLMEVDTHNSWGGYSIRSIYYDTPDDYFLRQVTDGDEDHTKFRVRIYNNSDIPIKVEKKLSHNGKKKKIVEVIDHETYDSIASKTYIPYGLDSPEEGIVAELSRNVCAGQLVPRAIIDYKRVAFTTPLGNIRVTIDEDISASREYVGFFDKKIAKVGIIPNYGVLEIKYDGFFPGYIEKAFRDLKLEKCSFSKYQLGREALDCWR
ncbi:MAG: polyphosphate polymerase domain-containing protein [Lachnospiraceae bacterium]|nr:polyphosphate polymerase domain-containing protein [Lachnospiraceae bacterium]